MSIRRFAHHPPTDATPLFEAFRWRYGSCLLTAALSHLGVFEKLAPSPLPDAVLKQHLGLEDRPFQVLITGLLAMGLIQRSASDLLELSELAREHLLASAPYYMGDYLGLAAEAPEVLDLVARLRTNRPADIDAQGHAFIYRDGIASAMDSSQWARHFTLSLAGRARNVAPFLAEAMDLKGIHHLVDVAGGTGIYALALLEQNPNLEITLVDLPEVLKVAAECISGHPDAQRLHLEEGDMFQWEPKRPFQAALFSNVLHDWDQPECLRLIERYAAMLPSPGKLFIHDVLLDNSLEGPLPIALYSIALFTLTEGRAYSPAEYEHWLQRAGLRAGKPVSTAIHCAVIEATQSSLGG